MPTNYAAQIEMALRDPGKLRQLRDFLEKISQHENLYFLMSYTDYKRHEKGATLELKAIPDTSRGASNLVGVWMYKQYIEPGAIMEVNVPGSITNKLRQIYNSPGRPFTSNDFTAAYKECLRTLSIEARTFPTLDALFSPPKEKPGLVQQIAKKVGIG